MVDHKGVPRVTCRTSRKRLRASLARVTEWLKAQRHLPVRQLVEALNSRLRGHYNYYGVIGNHRSLHAFFHQASRLLKKWLGEAKSEEPNDLGEVQRLAEAVSSGGALDHGESTSADGPALYGRTNPRSKEIS